jgi:hypothetical protein
MLQIFSNAQSKIDICGNSKFLLKFFSFYSVNKIRLDASKRKAIRQRYIFEVTKENIRYCRDMMKTTPDVRHLDENEANFAANEMECLGFVTMQKESL